MNDLKAPREAMEKAGLSAEAEAGAKVFAAAATPSKEQAYLPLRVLREHKAL